MPPRWQVFHRVCVAGTTPAMSPSPSTTFLPNSQMPSCPLVLENAKEPGLVPTFQRLEAVSRPSAAVRQGCQEPVTKTTMEFRLVGLALKTVGQAGGCAGPDSSGSCSLPISLYVVPSFLPLSISHSLYAHTHTVDDLLHHCPHFLPSHLVQRLDTCRHHSRWEPSRARTIHSRCLFGYFYFLPRLGGYFVE